MGARTREKHRSFWREHSLSLVTLCLLGCWTISYASAEPDTRWGAFCSNAIADWAGSLALIVGTKFLLESGSAESKPVRKHLKGRLQDLLHSHSLLLALLLTGAGWFVLFLRMNPQSKWGQVTTSLVSEWGQMAGLVFLTKRLVERGSEESK